MLYLQVLHFVKFFSPKVGVIDEQITDIHFHHRLWQFYGKSPFWRYLLPEAYT